MSRLTGYATSIAPVDEIISAYSSAPFIATPTQAVGAGDGDHAAPWTVIGSFTVPSAVRAKLQVSAINTGPAALAVRLYNPIAQDATRVGITSGAEALHFSGAFDFLPGVIYQIAVQYLGAAGSAIVRTVSLVSP